MSYYVQAKNVTMYGEQWAVVDSYAKHEGYTRSLALRKIVAEWAELKRRQLAKESYRAEPS